jgi:hypothetical protein
MISDFDMDYVPCTQNSLMRVREYQALLKQQRRTNIPNERFINYGGFRVREWFHPTARLLLRG